MWPVCLRLLRHCYAVTPLRPPKDGKFHVYCSNLNRGALALMEELASRHHFSVTLDVELGMSEADEVAGPMCL